MKLLFNPFNLLQVNQEFADLPPLTGVNLSFEAMAAIDWATYKTYHTIKLDLMNIDNETISHLNAASVQTLNQGKSLASLGENIAKTFLLSPNKADPIENLLRLSFLNQSQLLLMQMAASPIVQASSLRLNIDLFQQKLNQVFAGNNSELVNNSSEHKRLNHTVSVLHDPDGLTQESLQQTAGQASQDMLSIVDKVAQVKSDILIIEDYSLRASNLIAVIEQNLKADNQTKLKELILRLELIDLQALHLVLQAVPRESSVTLYKTKRTLESTENMLDLFNISKTIDSGGNSSSAFHTALGHGLMCTLVMILIMFSL